MCRGYHRRLADRKRPLRWLGTILLNVNRGENDPAQTEEEVMWLYGDPLPQEVATLNAAEIEAAWARAAELDKAFL